MAKWGGPRPNSGRKKGQKCEKTLIAELLRERLREKLAKRWDKLLEAQLDKAQGIKLEAFGKDGIYYKDPGPDTFAFKTVTEQAIGRPTETIDLHAKPDFLFDDEDAK